MSDSRRLQSRSLTTSEGQSERGTIAWMTRNKVAPNLLMIVFLVGGLLIGWNIKQEVFPEFELDIVNVVVAYPGAGPEEVEQGVVQAIEEAVRGLDGVKEVRSAASEGMASVQVELEIGVNKNKILQDIKNAIDRITTFPEDAEEPQVSLATTRNEVMSVVLYGDQSEQALRGLAEEVREMFLGHGEITQVDLAGVRPLEIAVEVPQARLREYGLTLGRIADLVRSGARELGAGAVKTPAGEVLLRLDERKDYAEQFGDIEIVSRPDGTSVKLRDIATIRDTFAETDQAAYYNGKPAVMVKVFRVGDQTPIEVANIVREDVQRLRQALPGDVQAAVLYDRAEIFEERISLLLRNGAMGLVLVLVLLGLFLEVRLAFWVTMGIPISFLGAFLFLPAMDVSVNMISLFAFIMALGIVVDDAIVVGENVFELRQEGQGMLDAAIHGAQQVAVPVTFSVLTNLAAFAPMLFVPGFAGKIFRVIPLVVGSVFIISLIESLYILPSHLAHRKKADREHPHALERLRQKTSGLLVRFIKAVYAPFLAKALRWRYVTIAVGVALLVVTVGMFMGGRIQRVFFPTVASDQVAASAILPYGAPVEQTEAIMRRLIEAAEQVIAEHGGEKLSEGIFSQVAAPALQGGPRGGASGAAGSHTTNVTVYLTPTGVRPIDAKEFAELWRERVGRLPGLETLRFEAELGGPGGGADIDIELSHARMEVLEQAAADLADRLAIYGNTHDIDDGFARGKPQLNFTVRPEARSLGLTASEVGRQVRDAFYGAEALRQQRGRDEVKVRVKLPLQERARERDVETFVLLTPQGGEIPLPEAAAIERGRAYTTIDRTEGRRIVHVTSKVTPPGEAEGIVNDLQGKALPDLMARYPGLDYELGGSQKEFRESMQDLGGGFIFALLVIYAMLAVPFRSYVQPLIVMTAIPFGIVGAVFGHLLMGYNISIISMFGIVALSGVVVNDSLVLIDYANRLRHEGESAADAIHNAGVRRFRPILLTSLTTFGGLAPMIFETSIQARFLIPMALSLGYGILFATVIALVLVPALYLSLEDLKTLLSGGKADAEQEP